MEDPQSREPGTSPAAAPPPAGAPAPRRLKLAALLLVGGSVAVVLAGTDSAVFDLERHLVPKALVLHVTALLLLATGLPSFHVLRGTLPGLLLGLFVAWSGLSALFAANPWLSFRGFGISFSGLLLFLAARRVGERYRWPVTAGLLGAAVLGAGFGVAQAYGMDWSWLAESRAPGGTFGNRNFLAHLSAIALGPLIVVAARARGRWVLPAVLGVALLVGAIVLTRSRAAWLGAGGALTATAITLVLASRWGRRARPWGRLLLAGGIVVAAAVAAVLVPNELDWSSDAPYAQTLERLGDYRGGSGAGRLVQYRNSLEMIAMRPVLGVGPGNWFVHYPRVTGSGDPSFSGHLTIPTNPWPSSDWIAFVAERGVLGALLLLLAGTASVFLSFAPPPEDAPARDPHAPAVVVSALVSALITGAFDAVLLLAAPTYLVFTLVGLHLPYRGLREAPSSGPLALPAPVRRRIFRGVAAGVAVALVAVTAGETAALALTRSDRGTSALLRAARVAPGEHRLHLMLAERGRCDNARRAVELMPHHGSARRLAEGCGR